MPEDQTSKTPTRDDVSKQKAAERAVGHTEGPKDEEKQPAASLEDMKKEQVEIPTQMRADTEKTTVQEQFEEEIDKLRDEFGTATDLFVDVRFNDKKAEFFLEALPVVRRICEARAGKARFYLHTEPNDEMYLMISPKPSDFDPAWVMMQNPQTGFQAYQQYGVPMLKAVLAYPKYEDIDWDVDGSGVYTPYGLTDSRLIDTFFKYEMNDPDQPNTASFDASEVDDAETIAKRTVEKPSF